MTLKKVTYYFLCFIGLIQACQTTSEEGEKVLFESLSATETGIGFINNLRESPSQNILSYEYFYNGAGLAIADFNNDGLSDIYFVSNLEPNALYLNQGELRFKEVAKQCKIQGSRRFSTGVATVDINADGWMDLYICKSGRFDNPELRRNDLYINLGVDENNIPIFEEAGESYGLDIPAYSTQAAFFDYDRDEDLDLFLINHGIDTYVNDEIPALQQQAGDCMEKCYFAMTMANLKK